MKRTLLGLIVTIALLAPRCASAAETRTYQVTGPIIEVSATAITVQKGNEKWEIARNEKTKIKGDLKIGSKVTIYYRMVAAEVELKDAETKGGKDAKAKK